MCVVLRVVIRPRRTTFPSRKGPPRCSGCTALLCYRPQGGWHLTAGEGKESGAAAGFRRGRITTLKVLIGSTMSSVLGSCVFAEITGFQPVRDYTAPPLAVHTLRCAQPAEGRALRIRPTIRLRM